MKLVKSRSEHFQQDRREKYEVAGEHPGSEPNGKFRGNCTEALREAINEDWTKKI